MHTSMSTTRPQFPTRGTAPLSRGYLSDIFRLAEKAHAGINASVRAAEQGSSELDAVTRVLEECCALLSAPRRPWALLQKIYDFSIDDQPLCLGVLTKDPPPDTSRPISEFSKEVVIYCPEHAGVIVARTGLEMGYREENGGGGGERCSRELAFNLATTGPRRAVFQVLRTGESSHWSNSGTNGDWSPYAPEPAEHLELTITHRGNRYCCTLRQLPTPDQKPA